MSVTVLTMDSAKSEEKAGPSIRDLFPALSDQQLEEVEATFHGYLETVWEIYEEVRRERPEFFDKPSSSS